MGKTIYDWWGYALRVLDKYPRLNKAARHGVLLSNRERRELAAVQTLLKELEKEEPIIIKEEKKKKHFS